jgi:hypothetical protein
MKLVLTLIGSAVILLALQDLFHTIFHPVEQGNISDWIGRMVWKLVRTTNRLSFAGPMAFVLTVLYWGISLVVGFALLYLPWLPDSFSFASRLDPHEFASFGGAVNLSLSTLITLSSGTYSKTLLLQFIMGLEAVLGFVLFTASISWILSIYPVIEHRRSLAHEANLLYRSDAKGVRRPNTISDSDLVEILLGLTSQMTTHRNELMQFPIAYYFVGMDSVTTLPATLPYVVDIAEEAQNRKGGVGLAGEMLGSAVDDYLRFVCSTFLHQEFEGRRPALHLLAADQRREAVRAPRHEPARLKRLP